MKILTRDVESQHPLDKYIGKNIWVKVIISGKDMQFMTYKGLPDTPYYIMIDQIYKGGAYYVIHSIAARYFDPQSRFYGQLTDYDISCSRHSTQLCSRNLTKIAQPIDLLTEADILEYIDLHDDNYNEG